MTDPIDELHAAQEVAFKLLMAAGGAANMAWNTEDDGAARAADIDYDAATRALATIDRQLSELTGS